MSPQNYPVKRALISVWDKSGLTELASGLVQMGVELLGSGGTAAHLRQADVPVTDLSTLTGFADLLGGRVKTLHPAVYASILARPGTDEEELQQQGLTPIDLVVVDLYPFAEAAAASQYEAGEPDPAVIEKIDIGGVSLLRAAAKNMARTTVVHDRAGRELLLAELRRNQGRVSHTVRLQLAASAMRATSEYDRHIADWLADIGKAPDNATAPDAAVPDKAAATEQAASPQPPQTLQMHWKRSKLLRYGENPHQSAALYRLESGDAPAGVYGARQLQGKEISYNNLQDAQVAWEAVRMFSEPACVIVKHANPCAAALGDSLAQAWQSALKADRTSPFGGIVAVNRPLDKQMAQALVEFGFLEVVLAPSFDAAAQQRLASKRNLRLLAVADDNADTLCWQWAGSGGALLVQQTDRAALSLQADDLRQVSTRAPSAAQLKDLLFAWKIAAFVKSNAIVCAQNNAVTAVGAGQMSRVFSMQIAALKAELEEVDIRGNVLASDAFFPFRDGIDRAAEQGISAIIQPGGSVRDAEVIEAANEHDIAMVFTGMRHFRH